MGQGKLQGAGQGKGCLWASFLSGDRLRYGARRDHVQQVLSLPVCKGGTLMGPNGCGVEIGDVQSWDVVDLTTAVVLQPVATTAAASSTAATVLSSAHPHQAAGH